MAIPADEEIPMKVFAVGNVPSPPTPEQRDAIPPKEAPHTLRLYLDGVIEQFWFRTDKPGVFFLMEVESLDQARSTVEALPLAQAGIMKFDLTPVGPLAPLARLLPAD
jgi:hypothetical protein